MAQICYDTIASATAGTYMAMDALNEIGADPTPALDGIVAYIENYARNAKESSHLFSAPVKLLAKCNLQGAEEKRRVVRALESVAERQMATEYLRLLWQLDPGNEAVIRRVDAGLRSDDSDMETACDVICRMKEDGAIFVPLLIERLEGSGDYWDFCWAAVDALGEIGPAAIGAKGILEKMKGHPSELVRKRAEVALGKICFS